MLLDMAYSTKAALLQKVRDAIEAIVTSRVESTRLADNEFRHLPLEQLLKMEKAYEADVARETRGSGVALARFGRPR